MIATVRFGTAGWSFEDWAGIVYPRQKPFGFDQLIFLSGYLDVIEINSSFYHPPPERNSRAWLRKTEDRPEFRFTAKLWQRFTHDREPFGEKEVREFRNGMDVMLEAGKLGALLVQFPWSFKNTDSSRKWLEDVFEAFQDYPLVLEVRHGSWNKKEVYEYLAEKGVGFVNIDQPLFSRSIKPSRRATAPVGYVRLHGRNYENWFRDDAGRDARYDYLYSTDELKPWADTIKALAKDCSEVFVVANNHFRGKALVNILELKNLVTGKKVKVPPSLFQHYPRIRDIARRDKSREKAQQELF
jgi:uncharacterized protein YecE (DUF72 family)